MKETFAAVDKTGAYMEALQFQREQKQVCMYIYAYFFLSSDARRDRAV
jgi:hypothetical protein